MTHDETGAPTLDELRRELEAVGMVVVPFRDEIHVRRSTLEYIKVRVDGGVLRCEPRIGIMSQARATWLLLAAEAIEIPGIVHLSGGASWALATVFVGVLAFGFHALRYTLADVAIGRVQAVWLDLRARHRAALAGAPATLQSLPPAPRELTPGTPALDAESNAQYVRLPR